MTEATAVPATSLHKQAVDRAEQTIRTAGSIAEADDRWRVLDRLRRPDRVIRFRVTWLDDLGKVQINNGWRVQYSNALGPYKGGLRFDGAVDEDTLLFLGYEQCFKNALTGLPIGGGKGGADCTMRDLSETERMRFCQAFMAEYHRHGGPDIDVPAGDIGVGAKEIGYLFGAYRRLTGLHHGVLTGKPLVLGGLAGRAEATGYGVVEFARLMLEEQDAHLRGQRVAISGSGNVALYAAQRALELGARVLTLSGRAGFAHFEDGLSEALLERIIDARENNGHRLEDMVRGESGVNFVAGGEPWDVACDVALPCATQNELDGAAAEKLIGAGVKAVAEGANMPLTDDANDAFIDAKIPVGPGKAANAGGVACSALEMSQNAQHATWDKQTTLDRLDGIIGSIHRACVRHAGTEDGFVDYNRGADVAGFRKLADAIIAQGVV